MTDETYGEERARKLESLLVALAARILELNEDGTLLRHTSELTARIGDVRSELFHYEVRATYDTPEVAESRRIVREALDSGQSQWQNSEWKAEDEDDPSRP